MNPADPTLLRMIDANANRAREALRVMEDYARFALNDPQISAALKNLRHALAESLAHPALASAILHRDTAHDVGTAITTASEQSRPSLAHVVIAAGKRLSESLRVLEECAKTLAPESAAAIEKLRYQGYIVEQTLTRFATNEDARARFFRVRLCILLTESLCHPTLGGWEKTLDLILSGKQNSALCIQLREKNLPDADLLQCAKILAQKCQAAGGLSIINDRPDIALLSNADGVHLGQTDLPAAEARKILGPDRILGVSTENLAQAHQAARDSATYIAVGPMFPTTTKEKPRLAGPAYAAEARRELPAIPLIAIGGITPENLPALTAVGIQSIAVCNAVIAQPDPAAAVQKFLALLPHNSGSEAHMLERFKITLLCILAAIVYGIIHDQITARVCLEYFTLFHPPILNDTHSPTLLGFGWGVIATWWVGFFLGVPLSICATVGKLPPFSARRLVKPVAIILLILGTLAAACGFLGYWLANSGELIMTDFDLYDLPPAHFAGFIADSFTHLASYGFGALLGIALCIWVLVKRYRQSLVRA